jgi:hypothetical protein
LPPQIIGIKQYLVRPIQCSSGSSNHNNNNITNNNNNNNNNNNVTKNSTASPNTSATSSESGSIASTSFIEPLISDQIIQASGKPLGEVINDVSAVSITIFLINNSLTSF